MKIKLLALLLILVITSCGKQVTGEDVIKSFKDAGLEAENTRPMTKDDYGIAPFVCEGTRFFIPSLGADNGGRIFICENTEDRDALVNYYTELGRASAIAFSWVFTKDNVVVQINGDLPEAAARQYEAALP